MTTFTFGKYKGKLVKDIVMCDPKYAIWFYENVKDQLLITEKMYQGAVESLFKSVMRNNLRSLRRDEQYWRD